MGEVAHPGRYLVPEGKLTAAQAVSAPDMGAGVTPAGSLSTGFVQRKNGDIVPLDLRRILRDGDTRSDLELHAGDAVVVPLVDRITIVGSVMAPATFATDEKVDLVEALVRAGGPRPDAALREAAVVRGAQRIPVDLEALWRKGDQKNNVPLKPGDVIVVPLNEAQVLVLGEVAKPGSFTIKPDDKVMDILANALPFSPKANLEGGRLLRATGPIPLDLRALQNGKVELNLPLQPGDVIVVPEAQMVYVFGGVGAPGKRPWKPGYTLTELLADSGGYAPQAELGHVRVSRQGGGGGTESTVVNLQRILDGTDPGPAPEVQPGDIVLVPVPKSKNYEVWREYRDMLWTGVSLFQMFR
jgi:protein involved in polysaccharide export with SLBB domain